MTEGGWRKNTEILNENMVNAEHWKEMGDREWLSRLHQLRTVYTLICHANKIMVAKLLIWLLNVNV